MTEWMIKLEQAKKLLDSGGLTQSEFDLVKEKLLSPKAGYCEESEQNTTPAGVYTKIRWIWIVVGFASIILAGLYYFGTLSSASLENRPPKKNLAVAASPPVATESAAPTPIPESIELAETIPFSAPSECTAGRTLESMFGKLDAAMDNGSPGTTVHLNGVTGGLPISASVKTDSDETISANAGLRFPAGTTWNGLQISRITASRITPAESDSSYSRTLNFLEPATKVLRVLNARGFQTKLAPGFSELHNDECGGSMEVTPIPGGAALSCSWGC